MTTTQGLDHDVIKRLTVYLTFLKDLPAEGPDNITPEKLGEGVGVAPRQIVSDVALINAKSHPKIGYIIEYLTADIERALGYDSVDKAILVGVGHLGKALLAYPGFSNYGMEIVAAFDVDPSLVGTEVNGKQVYDVQQMAEICETTGAHIGIITAPAPFAQIIANTMVECHIRGIWNFAPTYLSVPETVLVENENIADSLAVLSHRLSDQIVMAEIEKQRS